MREITTLGVHRRVSAYRRGDASRRRQRAHTIHAVFVPTTACVGTCDGSGRVPARTARAMDRANADGCERWAVLLAWETGMRHALSSVASLRSERPNRAQASAHAEECRPVDAPTPLAHVTWCCFP